MDLGQAIRERILQICYEKKITVNKMATICGITQSTLSNIMSGRNNGTTVSTVKKICDGMDMTLKDFFDFELFYIIEQEVK